MGVTARVLMDRYGIDPTTLWRWRQYGWITPEAPPSRGGNHGGKKGDQHATRYPRWVERMVALIAIERDGLARGLRDRGRPSRDIPTSGGWRYDMLAAVAAGLAVAPDCDWFVFLDGNTTDPWPCHTAQQVQLAVGYARKSATIVAVP